MLTGADLERPRLLILGYARHGKDTVAEMLHRKHGFRFISSSEFVGRECIWGEWGQFHYDSFAEMFEDRINWRELWMSMIAEYNTPQKDRTAKTMLGRGYDLYVGMRRYDELEASRDLFDYIIWVDRFAFLPQETGSMDITRENAEPDFTIDNNGTLEALERNVDKLMEEIL